MAHHLKGFPPFALCLTVMVAHQSIGISSHSWVLSRGVDGASAIGLCASSVIIHGYKCQEVKVKTKDGYILNLQRIRGAANRVGETNDQPIIIQHGVLVDGMTWFLNQPDQSLPLILADQGYDVWISNTRGTRFSRQHAFLKPNEPDFWNWSWDELVMIDLPAIFDYVHHQTGQKIHYIGHSLGTLVALGSLSERLLLDKLQTAALLSPVAYLSHMTSVLGVVAAKSIIGEITTLFGIAEFNPKGVAVAKFLKFLCSYHGVDCYDFLTSFTGKNCCLNASTIDLFLKNEPQPTSTKNLVHLAQIVRDGIIAKYDYGNVIFNMLHYGESKPPIYNISNIPSDFPIFISYGGQDAISDVRDVSLLLNSLKLHDNEKLIIHYVKDYAHADFIMGTNAKDVVYKKIVSFFKFHS